MINEFGDLASFALQSLADIYAQTESGIKACEAYKRSLKLNPFLWNSFECACNLGEKLDPVKCFQVSGLDNFSMCNGSNQSVMNFLLSHSHENSHVLQETPDTTNSLSHRLVHHMITFTV